MTKINRDFLEKICDDLEAKRPEYSTIFDRGGRLATNVYNLGEGIYTFTRYNFLPDTTDDILDGHYTIVVNSKNLNYFIFCHAYYGSLTYTRPSKDNNIYFKKDLPKNSKDRIDFVVADTLLGTYFYDSEHINQEGVNLFKTKYCVSNDINDYMTRDKRACIFDINDNKKFVNKYKKYIAQLK